MQVYLDSYGAFLGVRHGMFFVKPKGAEGRALPVREVKAIFLSKGVRVSTDALQLAIQEDIPVVLTDGLGRATGQVWSGQFGSISTIRKQQALFSMHMDGLQYVAGLLQRRAAMQLENLSLWSEKYPVDTASWERGKAVLSSIINRHRQAYKYKDAESLKDSLRGWEGTATRHYFQLMGSILKPPFVFDGRSKRPAYDPFNALLNYLYGMLYPIVELALMKAGLDPYTGILHADEYNRPTLVYDMIEPYRHWAEWVAIELCNNGSLGLSGFEDKGREGFWLGPNGKNEVIGAFLAYLESPVHYHGKQRRRALHIDLDALQLAAKLRESDFKPFE